MILPAPPSGPNLRARLKWQVCLEPFPGGDTLYVTSDPVCKRHTIRVPTGELEPIRWLEAQHEYAHCLLAEQVHHLFSTAYFAQGTPPEILKALEPVHRTAADWFVDGVTYRIWPGEGIKEIEEHIRLFLALPKSETLAPEMSWGCVYLVAQLIYYKGHKGLIRKVKRKVPEIISLTGLFLRYDPGQPSIKAILALENAILKEASRGRFSLRLRKDPAGIEVLQIMEEHAQKS